MCEESREYRQAIRGTRPTVAALVLLMASMAFGQRMGGMGGGGMGGGSTAVDPPVSGAFVDPAEMPTSIGVDPATGRRVVQVALEARIAPINVNGTTAMDYTGMTMFHCHILEHEDIGMMGMWHIMDPMMPMSK